MQEVIVIGGGMVGAATALGLAKLGLKVAILEKNALPTFQPSQPYDVRISAISATSVKLLEALGAWQAISAMRICPYDGLETWEIDGFQTAFHAHDLGLNELGYMVENNLIQLGLWGELAGRENVTQVVGFEQLSAQFDAGVWTVKADAHTFSAPLIIACDGARSQARQWAGIGLTSWQYRQHCLLAVVETALPQQSATWQQFFPSGPRAFLPLLGNHGCVVWYDAPERIAQLNSLPAEQLRLEIQRHFPARLGDIQVQSAARFPLTRQHAQHYFKNGVVLVGDSAHTINPLAGQGVNLGFKDVRALLNVVEHALQKGEPLHSEVVLRRYERTRRADNLLMQSAMDVFYKTFKTDLLPVKIARNLGLLAAEKITPLKKRALRYALGMDF